MVVVLGEPLAELGLSLPTDCVVVPDDLPGSGFFEELFEQVELPLVEIVWELHNFILRRLLREYFAYLHHLECLAHWQVKDLFVPHS